MTFQLKRYHRILDTAMLLYYSLEIIANLEKKI
jgi:hypothetical protein